MLAIALLLVSSCLGDSNNDIEYKLWYNYDIEVYDWQGKTFHGQKPARGTSVAVNTPYGLYLDGQTVVLPPNLKSSSTIMKDHDDFTLRLIMRYIPGVPGIVSREIISLKKDSDIRLQLRQQSASETSSLTFELESSVGGTPFTQIATDSYAQSKTYLGKWYYFQISVERNEGSISIKLCINDTQMISRTVSAGSNYDWSSNTLGGSNTKGIYYWFYFHDNQSDSCNGSGDTSYFVTTARETPCSYVCPSSNYLICDTDGVTLDYECDNCSASCGNYGCVQDSPSTCWTADCPPSGRTDELCARCYAGSLDNHSSSSAHASECKCASDYYRSTKYPLTCLRKL
jgi:hypothetical protein